MTENKLSISSHQGWVYLMKDCATSKEAHLYVANLKRLNRKLPLNTYEIREMGKYIGGSKVGTYYMLTFTLSIHSMLALIKE